MNISLTPQLDEYVKVKVQNGEYASASEVLRDGLRALQNQDIKAHVDAQIKKGLEEAKAGLGVPFDDKVVKRIKSKISQSLEIKT